VPPGQPQLVGAAAAAENLPRAVLAPLGRLLLGLELVLLEAQRVGALGRHEPAQGLRVLPEQGGQPRDVPGERDERRRVARRARQRGREVRLQQRRRRQGTGRGCEARGRRGAAAVGGCTGLGAFKAVSERRKGGRERERE